MGIEIWFEQLKQRIIEKKTEKLRHLFCFLIEEYRSSQEKTESELKRHQEVLNELYVSLNDYKTIHTTEQAELRKLITELTMRIDQLSDSDIQTKADLVDLLQGINAKLESIDEKAKDITFSIDETKSLMKIIAVNNLLDDLNYRCNDFEMTIVDDKLSI